MVDTVNWEDRLPAYYANVVRQREKQGYTFAYSEDGFLRVVAVSKNGAELHRAKELFTTHALGHCFTAIYEHEMEV